MTKSSTLLLLAFLFLISSTTEFPLTVVAQDASPARTTARKLTLTPHKVTLKSGHSFTLNLPKELEIAVAVEGLKRVRFMTESPDHRIFVTDMYNLTDNRKGVVYILDEFDEQTKKFRSVIPFMTGLRNPNSVAFFTDDGGVDWFYLALTDRLVRYRYEKGATKPTGVPQVLTTFPDYGLGYKYGGWHLTRTISVGTNRKIYVSVGSSCNACEEKEAVRASVMEMDPDGKNQHHYVSGLRNAVGLRWIDGQLLATSMGSDHLGTERPADIFLTLQEGANYGWPYCFQSGSIIYSDPKFNIRNKFDCKNVPVAHTAFAAHSSPLGFEYFGDDSSSSLRSSYLVALHGSTRKSLGRGYRVVRVQQRKTAVAEDFITGFKQGLEILGRPADIHRYHDSGFLLTDDRAGLVYFVYPK